LGIRQFTIVAAMGLLLCGPSVEQEADTTDTTSNDRRYDLELYIHQVTEFCDMQIEEIAALISESETEELRKEHYAWKLERGIKCAEVGRTDPDEFSELECLAQDSESYFEKREREIAELKERRAKSKLSK
jgi:hypothetical protein